MKKFKDVLTLSEQKKGTIVDLGDDGSNPEVQISGYGRMNFETLKRSVVSELEQISKNIKQLGNLTSNYNAIYGRHSVLQTKLQALIDVEAELQTPQMKKKITLLKKR